MSSLLRPSEVPGRSSVLFVEAGVTQRDAIVRAQASGFRVVAVDGDPRAPGLVLADEADELDFRDLESIIAFARRHAIDGVLTVGSDRAVPVVAAVAEALGLPGIGSETAQVMRNKGAAATDGCRSGRRQPRPRPRTTRRRASGLLHRDRRNDPARPTRHRPTRLRDRDQRDRQRSSQTSPRRSDTVPRRHRDHRPMRSTGHKTPGIDRCVSA